MGEAAVRDQGGRRACGRREPAARDGVQAKASPQRGGGRRLAVGTAEHEQGDGERGRRGVRARTGRRRRAWLGTGRRGRGRGRAGAGEGRDRGEGVCLTVGSREPWQWARRRSGRSDEEEDGEVPAMARQRRWPEDEAERGAASRGRPGTVAVGEAWSTVEGERGRGARTRTRDGKAAPASAVGAGSGRSRSRSWG